MTTFHVGPTIPEAMAGMDVIDGGMLLVAIALFVYCIVAVCRNIYWNDRGR